jgi:DNA (cytosine-5)-methyltransferase 1
LIRADETIVDLFAGGGGASLGIFMATGRHPDVAINHDPAALGVHALNHPGTAHLCSDGRTVRPEFAAETAAIARGLDPATARVGLLHASPDCKHFSKAKGGQPRDKGIRDLAWVVVRYAVAVRPRIITLENVEEFQQWGPLIPGPKGGLIPCPARKALTFRRWVAALKAVGYAVDWRELRACDYGTPTIRKRLFVVARCDGAPIVWPAPTHAKDGGGGRAPWRTAASIIDWSLPCPSIFLSKAAARKIGCKRPLAPATLGRIARGIKRYVLDNPQPFLIPVTHTGDARVYPIDDPLRTVTGAKRGEIACVAPHVTKFRANSTGSGIDEPLHTITGNSFTAQGRAGGCAPMGVVAAFLAQHNSGVVGHDARAPVSTIVGKGCTQAVVAAPIMSHAYSSNTAGGQGDLRRPVKTVLTGGHHALVSAFLAKYYGTDQDPRLDEPLHTATTKPRFAVVTVTIDGVVFALVDIGMRMLSPRELFRAQGFPDAYVIDRLPDGTKLTKDTQVRLAGNSVCPQVMAALLGAQLGVAATSAAGAAA